ncbi:MAG: enoyl-CoA hydratase/isomerase family protein [Hyphomicrobiales bacterium]|nr:enoyl-CoA hydratase/isomerase family protein [Hyphomicrobiales bacterium]
MMSLTIDTPIATVVLDRPPVNAISDEWLDSLNAVLDRVSAGNEISVLHIKSSLKTFCAGADLNLMRSLLVSPEGRNAMVAVVRRIQHAFLRLEALPAVTVAELGGAALGGGLELALTCDLRVASESARLGLPEARLGLVPGAGGTQRLPRICGEAVARRLILGAEVIDGQEAARLGLVQWAVPDAELADWTQTLVRRLAALPGSALAACKSCMAAAIDGSPEGYDRELQVTRELHSLAETQRRIQAFLERA